MMGNIGPIANFDVKIGNIQNIFYMMGNSMLKMMLCSIGKRMAQRGCIASL
jgi:hypothetical protein